jgi:O-antigen/teichoic acid export membrane protein
MALYGSSRSLVEGMIGVRGILLAAILGPRAFGVWALFRLILTYGTFAGLGLARGLELEVARARAPEQAPLRAAWGRTALGCVLAVFGTLSVAALLAAGLVREPWVRELLWAVAVGLLLERLWFYGLSFTRASGSLRRYAALELMQAAAQLGLTTSFALVWGLAGAFLGFALANLLAILLLHGRAPLRPSLEIDRLRSMLAVGLPLSLSQLLNAMLTTVDRLFVGAWLGIGALGQYAFAVSVASLGVSAALVVQTVVFPDVYGRLDRDGAAGVTRRHLDRTIRPFVLLIAPLAGAGALLLSNLIAMALPQYLAAAKPASVFVFTGVAQGVVSLATVAVVAARQQRVLPLLTLAALCMNASLAAGTLALDLGLMGLASGAALARLSYAVGVLALVARAAGSATWKTAWTIIWPLPWCTLVTAAILIWLPPIDIGSCFLALGAYGAGVAPVLASLWRVASRPWREAA